LGKKKEKKKARRMRLRKKKGKKAGKGGKKLSREERKRRRLTEIYLSQRKGTASRGRKAFGVYLRKGTKRRRAWGGVNCYHSGKGIRSRDPHFRLPTLREGGRIGEKNCCIFLERERRQRVGSEYRSSIDWSL